MKKFWLLAGILLLVAAGILIYNQPRQLEVYFFDVGQGDSTLVKNPSGGTVLIDGGPDRKVLRYLGKSLPFGQRNLDLMILTHPHADHVTGLVGVLERYKIGKVLATGALHTTTEYLEWLRLLNKKNIPWQQALAGQTISFSDGVRLEALWPNRDLNGLAVADLNESSVTVRIVYGRTAVLITGDITVANEADILASGGQVTAQILKVPHQGSRTSSSLEFIKAVKPTWAVIFVGANNRYGHPHGEVVARYEQQGVEVLRTDQQGTIKFVSDGTAWRRLKPWSLLNF